MKILSNKEVNYSLQNNENFKKELDYEIGDIVYCIIKKGSFMVGLEKVPQSVRVFGFNLNISDNGIEEVTGLQTNYSSIQ